LACQHAHPPHRRTAVWDTVQFAANGSIFVLLGEQMPPSSRVPNKPSA